MPANPNPIDVHVGHRVRLARLFVNMSQGQLADAVGVTFQQVQKYEKGTNRVSASRLYQLAQVLGVDVPFFFRDVESSNAHHENRGDVAFDRVDVKFLTCMAQIKDPDIKEKILGVLESLAEADEQEESEPRATAPAASAEATT